jgi:SSS family solute:Na+ symporter
MDIYKGIFNHNPERKQLVTVGRIATIIFVLIGCTIAPQLGNPRFMGIFTYIQEFQGFISPGVLAAFLFGLVVKKAPPSAGVTALVLNFILYGILLIWFSEIAFLNRMAISFIIVIIAMAAITWFKPLTQPIELPVRQNFDMHADPLVKWLGAVVILITLILYAIFW